MTFNATLDLVIAIISNIVTNNNIRDSKGVGLFDVTSLETQFSVDNSGVTGWVKNNSPEDANNVHLIIHWFNEDHAPIGTDRISIGDINSDETKEFDANIAVPRYDTKTWEFEVD